MNESKPAYISKVHLKGYKSIKDLEIDLQMGLNIIIGPNGSGKTNFLEFLEGLVTTYSYSHFVYQEFEATILAQNLGNKWQLNIKANLDTKTETTFVIAEEIYKNNKIFTNRITKHYLSGKHPEHDVLLSEGKPYFDSLKNRISLVKYSNELDSVMNVGADIQFKVLENKSIIYPIGQYNLLFLSLIKDNESHYKSVDDDLQVLNKHLIETLQKFTPIKDLKFQQSFIRSPQNNSLKNIRLNFLVNDRWCNWSELSDGTKRLFYIFLTFLSNITIDSDIYLLEEPELGLHPNQLYKLMQFLKEQSKEKQIIITTHSPEVLNILGEDELDRIIVTRYDSEKGTKMYQLSEKEQTHVRNYMKHQASISDYWIQSGFEKENEEEVTS